jgi:dTDP-4-dehydrorhamnose 3,5-epimerase
LRSAPTGLSEVLVFEPTVFGDDRGAFFESFNQRWFLDATGLEVAFVQDNQSTSRHGVLRGLHYQLPPMAQGKLVRVVRGAILDVAVDVRRASPSFSEWVSVELTAENRKQLWVPPGFAHGFVVLSDIADVLYKTTEYYSPEHDRGIRWDDPTIGISWPDLGEAPILSAKDAEAPFLADAEVFE